MESFRNDIIIRLRNNQDKYLIADQDGESITKSKSGSTKKAQWIVEIIDEETIHLRSCYGKYLTASNKPSIPGVIGKKLRVIQTLPYKPNSSHQWQPLCQSIVDQTFMVQFKTPHGSYLQSSNRLGNLVTHALPKKEVPSPNDVKTLWQVEIVKSPSELFEDSESVMSKMLFGVKSFVSEMHKEKEKSKASKDDKETQKEKERKRG